MRMTALHFASTKSFERRKTWGFCLLWETINPSPSPLSSFPLILRILIIFCPFRSPLLPLLLQSVSLCCFHIPFYLQLPSFCSCHFLLSPCISYPPPLFMRRTLFLSSLSTLSPRFLPYVSLCYGPLFVVPACVSLQHSCVGCARAAGWPGLREKDRAWDRPDSPLLWPWPSRRPGGLELAL